MANGSGVPRDIVSRPRERGAGSSAIGIPGADELGGVRRFMIQPPNVDRPPGARDFNQFGTLAGISSASGQVLFPTATFQLPQGRVAVIRSVLLLINGLLVTSDVRFAILFNTNPVDGWNSLTINPRAAASVEIAWTPEETFIPVPEAATIDMRAQVNDAGTYQLSVAYHGWHYAAELETSLRAAWA